MMGTDPQDTRPRIHTMEELSLAIGVSRPTLSRFFRDPASVRDSTSKKIIRALEAVEYVPNFFATRMNRKTTGVIGVLIPYLNDLFFTKLLESIELAAIRAGFTVISQASHSDPQIEARAIQTLMSMNLDGALIAPLGNDSDEVMFDRLRKRLPYVMIDSRPRKMQDVDFVGTDHQQSTGLMVDYLCRTGPPPIFLAMPPVNFNAIEREHVYVTRMQQLGHSPVVIGNAALSEGWHFEDHGLAVLDECFSRGQWTRGSILCVNDRVAMGALHAAMRHGLLPQMGREGDLRIAGHDDNPLSRFTNPSLTTVAQDINGIGMAAVARLLGKVAGSVTSDTPVAQLFNGQLRLRKSA